nr:MAG TPA: hypothetical protein [Caudoviricetes sp.]
MGVYPSFCFWTILRPLLASGCYCLFGLWVLLSN